MQTEQYPKIRFVDFFPVQTENGQMIALRDQSGISPETLVISPDVFYLLQFCDGQHSFEDLQSEYLKIFSKFLQANNLRQVLEMLDEYFFLENDRFRERRQKIETDFVSQPVRPAAHAGTCYQAEPTKLKEQIAGFFKQANGIHRSFKGKEIKGMIAPHIDIRAGGVCYSYAYKALAEAHDIDCFVILGTGHSGLTNLYSVLAKDFATPFGLAKCDFDFIQQLKKNYPDAAYPEVLSHKTEHTIEFQLVFLQYLLQQKRPFTFVPILCSFSYHMLDAGQFKRESEIIDKFTYGLKRTIAEFDKKVCLVASVDFSHVGPQYGDQNSPDERFMANVHKADKELITKIEAVDGDGFYKSVAGKQDQFRVCGFSPIYTMLKAIDAKTGHFLNSAETKMDEKNSTVTFASMVLE